MSESTRKIFSGRPRALSQMLDLEHGATSEWPEDELAAMLKHELETSLRFDLQDRFGLGSRAGISRSCARLFSDPNAPLELLILVKDYAKAAFAHPESSMAAPVAETLYLTSIALALNRWDQRISHLAPATLRRNFQRLADQAWVTDPIRAALRGGIRALDARAALCATAG